MLSSPGAHSVRAAATTCRARRLHSSCVAGASSPSAAFACVPCRRVGAGVGAMSDELTKLWRVRKTVHKMLEDRKYLVSRDDLQRSKEGVRAFTRSRARPCRQLSTRAAQFKELFGESPRREDLTILAPKRDDPDDLVRSRTLHVPRPARRRR